MSYKNLERVGVINLIKNNIEQGAYASLKEIRDDVVFMNISFRIKADMLDKIDSIIYSKNQ